MGTRLFLLATFLLGCAHLKEKDEAEELDHGVDLYWKAVHWQDPVAGSAFVIFDARRLAAHSRQEEKDLNVTSYEVQGQRIEKDHQRATILVKGTWYQLPSLVEKTDIIEQRWTRVEGHWLVVSEKGPLPFP